MRFWKRLRWLSTAAFIALLLWSWWAVDSPGSPAASPTTARPFTF
jgi:hypothetical protein